MQAWRWVRKHFGKHNIGASSSRILTSRHPGGVVVQLQPLIRRWNSEGLRLLPPESPAAVQAAFERLGSKATREVVEFFSVFGGMDEMDNEYLTLWSLQNMVERENETQSEFGPVFADYLLSCWCFRLRPNDEETSAVYVDRFNREEPVLVAPSLTQFLAVYQEDPKAAHCW